jgi:hypothetical protein
MASRRKCVCGTIGQYPLSVQCQQCRALEERWLPRSSEQGCPAVHPALCTRWKLQFRELYAIPGFDSAPGSGKPSPPSSAASRSSFAIPIQARPRRLCLVPGPTSRSKIRRPRLYRSYRPSCTRWSAEIRRPSPARRLAPMDGRAGG